MPSGTYGGYVCGTCGGWVDTNGQHWCNTIGSTAWDGSADLAAGTLTIDQGPPAPPALRLFAADFKGRYLPGRAIVVAASRDDANAMLLVELAGRGLLPIHTLGEVPLDRPAVTVLWDGDY